MRAHLATDLLVPKNAIKKSKCFIWCRLGARRPFFLSLSCTEVVPTGVRNNSVRCFQQKRREQEDAAPPIPPPLPQLESLLSAVFQAAEDAL